MRARRSNGRRALALLLVALLAAGCWDRREIEDQSIALATAVDLCEEDEDCHLISTRQIAIPGRIPLGAGAGGSPEAETVLVLRSPGRNGPDTAAEAQARLNHPLTFGHTRLVILGQDFARAGIRSYVDYLRRLPELRRLMWIAVAEGRGEEIMRARPTMQRVPALYLSDMLEDAVRTGRLPNLTIGEFFTAFSNRGQDAVAPLFRLARPDLPELAGLAVFRGDRMAGTLNRDELATFMQLMGYDEAKDLVRLSLEEGQQVDLSIHGRGARYQVTLERGRVQAQVQIQLEAEVGQLSPGISGRDPATLRQIESAARARVRRRAQALIARLQTEMQADILALGERVRAQLPAYWQSVDNWPAEFARAAFTVDVEVDVRRTGATVD